MIGSYDDKKQECFRKYKEVSDSYKDHSKFLKTRSRYNFLFQLKKDDYKGWAKELRAAGYATDKKYPQKLISLIERYKLYKFDKVHPQNPHEYIDHIPHIVLLIELKNGKIIAAYTEKPFTPNFSRN